MKQNMEVKENTEWKLRSGTGTEYMAKDGEISITGGRENDAQDIYALYPQGDGKFQTLGKLKVLSYKELGASVKIVPVNGNTIDEKSAETYLNDLYGQLGIRFTVSKDENFVYTDENLQSENSSFFSRYTNEMKALNAAYKSQRGVDKQTVYLFVLNTGNVKAYDLAGDMPRGGQFGYIFRSGQSETNINRTIAHELGHGKFKLRHTFDSDYGGILKQGTTDNLMDYGTGTHLAKWQWDFLFDPALLVSPFEGDEEGMDVTIQENPFMWLMIPRNNKNISIEDIKNFFKSLLPGYNKYGFPKEFTNDFVGFILDRASLTLEIKVELHWRLIQVAGAIWENDGLSNVLRLLEQGKLPSWEEGKNALEKLTSQQRAEIKKNDANKMSALLLYEFAIGSTEYNQTDFTESDAFTKQLNKDDMLLKETIGRFYDEFKVSNITDETTLIQLYPNKAFPTRFSFSPDHTGSIKESWEKHIQAWNNNPVVFVIGGMRGEITKIGDKFRLYFYNEMGLYSLALHSISNVDAPGPLRTTIQTFTFDLTLEQFRKYKK